MVCRCCCRNRIKSKSGDYLSVHYNGTFFSDSKIFDSSILRYVWTVAFLLQDNSQQKRRLHPPIPAYVFSNSREEPFVFQIGRQQMIEGWEKGLLDMCVGEKRKLVVPSDMVRLRSRSPLVQLLEQSNLINDAPFPIFAGLWKRRRIWLGIH